MTQEATEEDPIADLLQALQDRILHAAGQPITREIHFPEEGYSAHFLQEIKDNPKAEIVNDDCGDPQYYTLTIDKGRNARDTFYICVDLVERNCGGPEEGGWYYDTGEVMAHEPVRVVYGTRDEPILPLSEIDFIRTVAQEWIEEFESFESNHRSSVRPRGDDYRIRVTYDVPKDWNSYQPYC